MKDRYKPPFGFGPLLFIAFSFLVTVGTYFVLVPHKTSPAIEEFADLKVYSATTIGDWRMEVWSDGFIYETSTPITLSLRVTNDKINAEFISLLVAVKMRDKCSSAIIRTNGTQLRAKRSKQHGRYEVNMPDALCSDSRREIAYSLFPGIYDMGVRVSLESGEEFCFHDLRLMIKANIFIEK